jgi:hypothetical protein
MKIKPILCTEWPSLQTRPPRQAVISGTEPPFGCDTDSGSGFQIETLTDLLEHSG